MTDTWKYIKEAINKVRFKNYKPYIILTFEPGEDLKQIIKDNHCTYCVIPKTYIPEGEDTNCFIMFDKPILSFSNTKENFI